ncbi:respiratory nitrate reductase subunit gamma [Staphylococcus saccharolyticus]|uniref:respiratory nitrate reductase subunit gamma n=1 Tax=Staphylococcus saccharolyticus TaxID=33028 RepID=UPI00102D941E|nr:respiratory nitrate reductase subunit gamma [Staphylococcus saccharolyticus]MBL7573670.1 respiratory nitrate reductase subunit gamma [Staphylococcus saccharolyticus]MBL7584540.1 respiratory nitrate reductase subunit gamma [Staphylococcus saccharolyticus]MBL7639402.1 respiratory nitrate reductase subunit gamma [Staphylococcus saccharolyticus]QRJ68719.1 respiratory nitrate reductase subunit gamma [Staphylococcus saccharolyticus]TAA92036.1 respiratory nitrate reductase subunit gamma [Staphyloc
MLNQFIWIIYPYLCLAIFVIGHIARYKYDQFSWTAKSSEMIEKRRLKWGSLLFHLGVIPVFFGHVVGLLIPSNWLEAVGVDNHIYHIGAVYIGSIFGIMTLIGMLLLTLRRLTIKNVRRLSSFSDIFVNIVLLIILLMGCYSTLVTNAVQPDFDYRQTIAIWFRHLFMFSPNANLTVNVPWSFKLHILLGFTVFACWPFTRLVHVWSVPLSYMNRRYIVYRKNKI